MTNGSGAIPGSTIPYMHCVTDRAVVLRRLLPLLLLCLTLASTPALAEQAVRLQLHWQHQFQFAGYYMALAKGFYRDAGLDVTIVEAQAATPAEEEVLAGRADFGIAGSGLILEHQKGRPVVALAAIMQTSPQMWLVRADSGIFTPRDLAGRSVMLSTSAGAELMTVLRQEGVELGRIKLPPLTRNGIDDLIARRIDALGAYVSSEPFTLRQRGVNYRIISPRDYGVHFYSDVLMTRADLARRDPEMVRAFTAASLRGWQAALADPETAIALIRERYAPQLSAEHLRFEAETLHKLIMPELMPIGEMNRSRWEFIANSYIKLGMTQGPVKLDDFLLPEDNGAAERQRIVQIAVGALLLILLVSAAALRYARLSRALRREIELRSARERELRAANAELEQLAMIDQLTGCWNRHKMEEFAAAEIVRARRYQQPLALIIFDVDHFKRINDRHGHPQGDAILDDIARRVQGRLRDGDGFARWGGEEFLIMLPCTGLDEASLLAEQLRLLIGSVRSLEVGAVSASFGVASLHADDTLEKLVKRADAALYRAKASGRNQVEREDARSAGGPLFRLSWNENFAFGVSELEHEHRQLFTLSNAVVDAIEENRPTEEIQNIINNLLTETASHFATEERDMAAACYPRREEHAATHQLLLEEAQQRFAAWQAGSLSAEDLANYLLRSLLARHIVSADRHYAQYRLGLPES
ncbi:hypothetical protein CKO20_12545 [Rhodocyclus tenuis]|nr:hypothetical protein [Rhodocyclus tenuis]